MAPNQCNRRVRSALGAHHRHDAEVAATEDTLTPHHADHATSEHRPTLDERHSRLEEPRALDLLLHHHQLQRRGHHGREHSRADGGANLLGVAELAWHAASQGILDGAVEEELRHDASSIVERVREIPCAASERAPALSKRPLSRGLLAAALVLTSVQHPRIHGERQPLLFRVLPIVGALQQRRICVGWTAIGEHVA